MKSISRKLRPGFTFVRAGMALGLVAVAAAVGVIGPQSPAHAVPGVELYAEDFSNGVGTTPVLLTNYTGDSGERYTADAPWLQNCNGVIVNMNNPVSNFGAAGCGSQFSFQTLLQMTWALGQVAGLNDAGSRANHAVAAVTEAHPGAGLRQFDTANPIPLASTNRYLTFSVDSAATGCPPNGAAPRLNFTLVDGATATPVGGEINPCTDPRATTYTAPAVGTTPAGAVRAGRFTATGAILFAGSAVGIRMTNAEASGAGNDAAFDNIRMIDVTPHMEKAFSPALASTRDFSTLTWTITNTDDLIAKPGWSFTDTLPAGMTVANPPAVGGTCANRTGTPSAGAASVTLGGDLAAGQASCTVTVNVVAPAGSYQNCAANMTGLVGMNPPTACAAVEFVDPSYTVAKTATPAAAKAGEQVTFTVTLTNTGTVPFTNTTVTDNLSGVIDDAMFNNDQSDNGAGGTFAYTAPNLAWTGTIPVGTPVMITYTATVGSPPGGDKTLKNTVVTPDSTNCKPGSTDPACSNPGGGIMLLHIKKTPGSITPKAGEKVVYTVVLTNAGTADYTGAMFTDDLTGVIDDATFNNDQSDAGAGGTFNYNAPMLSWTGTVPAGGTVTVTYSATVGNPPGGDKLLTNGVTGPPESNCGPGSTDPDCGGTPPGGGIPLLVLAKQPDNTTPAPGQTVTYTVTMTNDGTADYLNAPFTDNLADIIDDATFNNDAADGGAGGTFSYTAPNLNWTGTVPAGGTVTITYSATVNNPPMGNKLLGNKVLGPPDSNCGPGSTDPRCGGTPPGGGIPMLEIVKTAAPNNALAGDTVTYTVTLTNAGTADNPAAQFTDNLAGVIDDATYNNDADDAGAGGTIAYTAPNLSWAGTVPQGGTVTITYTVTVNDPVTGDKTLTNAVTSTTPGSNCPTGSTDPKCKAIPPGVPHLVITKTADPATPAAGAKVTYTITIENDGGATYFGASIPDDLAGVIDDATYNNDPSDNGAGGSFAYAAPVLTWTGDVDAGETATLIYSVTVNMPPGGDKVLNNAVTTPRGGECGPATTANRAAVKKTQTSPAAKTVKAGKAAITEAICTSGPVPIQSLTVNKVASAANPKPGDKVTYTVTLANTGAVDYTAVPFTDDLTDVIDDATYNNDQTDNSAGGTFSYGAPILEWTGDIAIGETVTLTYSITVNNPPGGNLKLRNAASANVPGSSCPPAAPCGTGGGVTDGIIVPLPVTGVAVMSIAGAGTVLTGLGILLMLTTNRKRKNQANTL